MGTPSATLLIAPMFGALRSPGGRSRFQAILASHQAVSTSSKAAWRLCARFPTPGRCDRRTVD